MQFDRFPGRCDHRDSLAYSALPSFFSIFVHSRISLQLIWSIQTPSYHLPEIGAEIQIQFNRSSMLPGPDFSCATNPTPFAQKILGSTAGDIIRFTLPEITERSTQGVLTDVLLLIRSLVPAPPAPWVTRQAKIAAMIALSCVMPFAVDCVECKLEKSPCYRIKPNSFA